MLLVIRDARDLVAKAEPKAHGSYDIMQKMKALHQIATVGWPLLPLDIHYSILNQLAT